MNNKDKTPDIIYVNRLANVVYKDGEILETFINKAKKDTPRDAIFDIFARIITRNSEQRKVLYHLIFDKEEYTANALSNKLAKLYNKSARTFQRAIDYLYVRKIIRADRHRILKVPIDYDLSLLDLDKVKSVIIHIN